MQISCSILSIIEKNDNCKENINKMNRTTCDYLHLDIMDGVFVEQKTLSDKEMLYLVENVQKPFDVHLMVNDIGKYIGIYKQLKPRYISIHFEATDDVIHWLQLLKSLKIGAGIVINPNTPITAIKPYLHLVDLVLVMGVEPGKGGQSFKENSVEKIKDLKQLREKFEYHYVIEVDGGINADTISSVSDADIVVSGSFITNSNNYQSQINLLKNI